MKSSISLDSVEKASYMAKYTAPAYSQLKAPGKSAFVTALLYRVSIITGCPIPEDKTELGVLEGELMCLFSENAAYRTLNIEEVGLAFRMNATEESGDNVKHYQQVFNLEYLAKVIRKYLDIRGRLEAKVDIEESRIRQALPMPDKYGVVAEGRMKEENDQDTRDIIQYHYDCFLAGELWMEFIMSYEYDLLDEMGIMQLDKENKFKLMEIAKERRLASKRGLARSKNDFSSLQQLAVDFANNRATASEMEALKLEAKRLAVWDLFLDLQALGINNVFDIKNFSKC